MGVRTRWCCRLPSASGGSVSARATAGGIASALAIAIPVAAWGGPPDSAFTGAAANGVVATHHVGHGGGSLMSGGLTVALGTGVGLLAPMSPTAEPLG